MVCLLQVRVGAGCWQGRDPSAASLSCLWCGRAEGWSERKGFPPGGRVRARQSHCQHNPACLAGQSISPPTLPLPPFCSLACQEDSQCKSPQMSKNQLFSNHQQPWEIKPGRQGGRQGWEFCFPASWVSMGDTRLGQEALSGSVRGKVFAAGAQQTQGLLETGVSELFQCRTRGCSVQCSAPEEKQPLRSLCDAPEF